MYRFYVINVLLNTVTYYFIHESSIILICIYVVQILLSYKT